MDRQASTINPCSLPSEGEPNRVLLCFFIVPLVCLIPDSDETNGVQQDRIHG